MFVSFFRRCSTSTREDDTEILLNINSSVGTVAFWACSTTNRTLGGYLDFWKSQHATSARTKQDRLKPLDPC